MRPAELLRRYVEAHNQIVRDGTSKDLAPLFAENATMIFVGIEVGPLVTRTAIDRAIHDRPPSDELTIGRILEDDMRAIAPYRWLNDESASGGEIVVEADGSAIVRLTIRVAQ